MNYLGTALIIILVFLSTCHKSEADTALIYHSNYSDAHTNVKAQLEADGYTVTLSTTGSVDDNLINNYDVVFDMKYNNSIGSNGKTRYQSFIQAGGVLVLVGENHVNHSNNNNTIAAFINNFAGGSVTIAGTTGGGSCGNDCNITQTNTDVTDSNYTSVGVYPYGAYMTGDGTWVAKSTSGKILWMRWSGDQLNSGYTGAVYVTFDINQFQSTYDGTNMAALISDTYTSILATPQAAISSSQQTEVNTAKNKSQTTNQIYLTQSGNGIDLDIVQDGDNNLIIGTDLTSAGSIQGDNNEITLTQKNNGNVLGIDVNGASNDVDIWQDTEQNAIVNITGASNTLDLEQLHLNNNGSHYSKVTVNGNSNSLTIDQKETGDKILFLDVDSSNNVQVDQKGTGDHYLNIILTDSHTLDITQDGSGDHDAHINLSGNNTSITLTQDSSTDQNYYLEQNCASASCSATVTQN
tara:strand:+ start:159 stop:1553 length:1395 start_codon:yes stop_codon:yes gene_type:complete